MEKKTYEHPEAEVICFEHEDVITASVGEGGITLPPTNSGSIF